MNVCVCKYIYGWLCNWIDKPRLYINHTLWIYSQTLSVQSATPRWLNLQRRWRLNRSIFLWYPLHKSAIQKLFPFSDYKKNQCFVSVCSILCGWFQEHMPFQDIYISAFKNDIEYSHLIMQTTAALQSNKFMQVQLLFSFWFWSYAKLINWKCTRFFKSVCPFLASASSKKWAR